MLSCEAFSKQHHYVPSRWARGRGSDAAARHSKSHPSFPTVWVQEFEVHRFETVCRALASVQRRPQNPEQMPIFRKLADRRVLSRRFLKIGVFRGFAAFAVRVQEAHSKNFGRLSYLGTGTEGTGGPRGGIRKFFRGSKIYGPIEK